MDLHRKKKWPPKSPATAGPRKVISLQNELTPQRKGREGGGPAQGARAGPIQTLLSEGGAQKSPAPLIGWRLPGTGGRCPLSGREAPGCVGAASGAASRPGFGRFEFYKQCTARFQSGGRFSTAHLRLPCPHRVLSRRVRSQVRSA